MSRIEETEEVVKTIVIQLGGAIRWVVQRDEDGWLGICDSLKLTASGATQSELSEVIHETLEAVFVELISAGDLKAYLKEMGWKKDYSLPNVHLEEISDTRFDIPVDIINKPS